ncbi:MAG: hypothetical protein GC168_09780 [Candidatus Hydrogenedens sp.]|nr:hypothetical protein [Candidatus Hydrogenedens sp.]
MVGISGLGGIPEPKSEGPAKARNERESASEASEVSSGSASSGDGVKISSEAQAAAELSRIIAQSRIQPELRAEKVAAARERIESGAYKDPEVVAKVAERLLNIL